MSRMWCFFVVFKSLLFGHVICLNEYVKQYKLQIFDLFMSKSISWLLVNRKAYHCRLQSNGNQRFSRSVSLYDVIVMSCMG